MSSLMRSLLDLRSRIPAGWHRVTDPALWFLFWNIERYRLYRQFKALPPPIGNSERALLFQEIAGLAPFSRLLEVGCAYGQNFHLLSEMYPDVQMAGIDPDPNCVEQGNRFLEKYKRGNVKLYQANGTDLSMFADNSVDVVYSSASLLYVNAKSIRRVMQEMVRVSRRAIVLLEIHFPNPYYTYQDCGSLVLRNQGGSAYWARDYIKLIKGAQPQAKIAVRKIPSPLWTSEHWEAAGVVLTATIDTPPEQAAPSEGEQQRD